MAKKSKTQRAKASAARKERKLEREQEELASAKMAEESAENVEAAKEAGSERKSLLKKAEKPAETKDADKATDKKAAEKKESKPKKQRFKFFHDVRAELRRVTWPSRTDVIRWTGVVVVALLFFGVFVALLDNVIITPLLVFVSGFSA